MDFTQSKTLYLLLALFFVIGLAMGYLFGVGKKSDYVSVVSNKPANTNTSQPVLKTNLTVREAYSIALAEARQWANDAYLAEINLASKRFDQSGAANGWKFTFYSKSKSKAYEVLVKDGESRGGEESAAAKAPQTLKGEMIDSSVLAKSFYSAYPEDAEIISLKMYYDSGAKKFIWTVFFPKGSHTIDAEN